MGRKKILTTEETLKSILEQEQALYDAAGIVRHLVVSFPNRHKPSLLGRLAVSLLKFSGGVIQMQFKQPNK